MVEVVSVVGVVAPSSAYKPRLGAVVVVASEVPELEVEVEVVEAVSVAVVDVVELELVVVEVVESTPVTAVDVVDTPVVVEAPVAVEAPVVVEALVVVEAPVTGVAAIGTGPPIGTEPCSIALRRYSGNDSPIVGFIAKTLDEPNISQQAPLQILSSKRSREKRRKKPTFPSRRL